MKKIHYGMIVLSLLLCPVSYANAQVNIGIGIGAPNLSIGINLPMFPLLTPVPGYPVYYAPQVDGNYFFYDSMYWVYQDDDWYASTWYNGPWALVEPDAVPLFVLRIPVRYYRQPPEYFNGWYANAPPRWGQHWGPNWENRRRGWDRWNHSAVHARAPQPVYQRQYSGNRYPGVDQQHSLRSRSYRYQPRDKAVRQHLQQQGGRQPGVPVQRGRQDMAPVRNQNLPVLQQARPHQQGAPADPHSQPPQRGGEFAQHPQQRNQPHQNDRAQPGGGQREHKDQRLHELEQKPPENNNSQESGRGRGQGQNKDDERGRDRNR